MIDLHSHICPGVDDGSNSLEESLAMVNLAYECGTRAMVVTPHYLNRSQCRFRLKKSDVIERYKRLVSYCKQNGSKMKFYCGAEHFGVNEIGALAAKDELIPINGSRYLLVEFDFEDDFRRVSYVIAQIKEAGYVPIVAHPERYDFLGLYPTNVYTLLEKGCLLQINKGSPIGRYGPDAQNFAKWLLDNHLAHFVASDCHSPFQRRPDMDKVHEMLTYRLGSRYVSKLFMENQLKVLSNEPIGFK
ncbi:MAG: tyrosine-protein phosphatase [Acutalibacteraceae bacterium]